MLCSEATNVEWLSPCTHEEADTRMLLHDADGVKQGRQKIVIRTVDTDVAQGNYSDTSMQLLLHTCLVLTSARHCLSRRPGVISRRVSLEEANARLGYHGMLSVV